MNDLTSSLHSNLRNNLAKKDTVIITVILLVLAGAFLALALTPNHWWFKAGAIAWAVLP